jgi:hypothetical protein
MRALAAILLLVGTSIDLAAQPNSDLAQFISAAKASIAYDLFDPSAAQFRNLFVSERGAVRVLCGEVNGKNRMGAYVGFRRFYATALPDLKQVEGSRPNSDATFLYERMAPSMCGNKVQDVE